MPSLYMVDIGDYDDGYIYATSTASWPGARDATAGTVTKTYGQSTVACGWSRAATRGGGTSYKVYRTFLQFNTSEIFTAPNKAELLLYGIGTAGTDFYIVESYAFPELDAADFDAIRGWSTGVSNLSNVTHYIGTNVVNARYIATSGWNTSSYNVIQLNATAREIMASADTLDMCIISQADLANSTPLANASNFTGMYFSENTGTSKDPYIKWVPSTPATFFGANF